MNSRLQTGSGMISAYAGRYRPKSDFLSIVFGALQREGGRRWPVSTAIKRLITAVIWSVAVSCVGPGCTMVKTSVVSQGATQYPREIRPLIFVNVRIESELDYLGYGKVPLRTNGLLFENAKTGKLTNFTFEWNPFISGSSKSPPYKIAEHSNAVITPVLITLEPGDYLLKSAGISSAGVANIYSIGEDLEEPLLRLSIPDKDFFSAGTLVIEIKEHKGFDVGNVLQGYKLDCSDLYATLRTLSEPEEEFAVKTYPFLKDLDLVPYIKLTPKSDPL